MSINKYSLRIIVFISFLLAVSCKKSFLEKKSNQSLLVPTTINDFQSLLDNVQIMNNSSPYLTFISVDDLVATDASLLSNGDAIKNSYLWEKEVYGNNVALDWNNGYKQVFYANVVLDGLEKLPKQQQNNQEFKDIKGSALFFRANAFYNLAQQFSLAYDGNAKNKLGIPIRLSSDVNIVSVRQNLDVTYSQIINDIEMASELLGTSFIYKSRPTKQACYALLSRVQLTMGNYKSSEISSSKCLSIVSKLLDYNTLDGNSTRPFPISLPNGNDEVIFYSSSTSNPFLSSSSTTVDPLLYSSYSSNDLRRTIFYRDRGNGIINFKGQYSGSTAMFCGLTVSETLINRAESRARIGKIQDALDDLNILLIKRYKTGNYMPYTITDQKLLLQIILMERRKELTHRGLRWSDLKRLNLDPEHQKLLTRIFNNQTYTLMPNDKRYAYPIPLSELQQSGIQQNER